MSYPPIYIINLKRAPERKLHIQRELNALNLPYQLVETIDRYDLHCPDYRRTLARQMNIDEHEIVSMCESMGESAAACALGHIKVYNLMIKNNIPVACILEDDGHLLPTFPDILTSSQEVSWDILMFSHHSRIIRKLLVAIHRDPEKNIILRRKSIILHNFAKLIRYKIFHPQLNLYTAYSILRNVVKYTALHYLNMLKKPFVGHQNDIRQAHNLLYHSYWEKDPRMVEPIYFRGRACELGALPSRDRSSWHKLASNHYIAKPERMVGNRLLSAMGYMLTRSTAIKCRHAIISKSRPVDVTISDLYQEENLNLYMVVPPCVTAAYNYLFYSARRR